MTLPDRLWPKTQRSKVVLAAAAGFILGSLWLMATRFVSYKSDHIHYHANFALYVDGQRDELDNFTFYEEVQACDPDAKNSPRTRVHLHDNINHVVHVHGTAATWGHLFANLGYTLGDDVFKNDQGVYVDGSGEKTLTFWLNGKQVDGIANRTIDSEDALLINYGDETLAELQERYESITKDAGDYNRRDDPSTCAGDDHDSFMTRLKASLGLD